MLGRLKTPEEAMRVLVFRSEKDGGYWAYTRQDGSAKDLPAELGPRKPGQPVEIVRGGPASIAGIGSPDEVIDHIEQDGCCIRQVGGPFVRHHTIPRTWD